MATSGTTDFDLTVDELIEEASQRVGGEFVTGAEAKSARISLNLLFIDLANRKHPLGKIVEDELTFVDGQREYTLDSDVVDVVDAVVRRDSKDFAMSRVTLSEDLLIPNKDAEGRPFQYTIQRTQGAPILKVWKTPENSTDKMVFWAIKRIEDVTSSRQTTDFSYRYFPALASGLAYFMSFKRRDIPANYREMLKRDYEEQLSMAFEEDRERASMHITPCLNRPRGW